MFTPTSKLHMDAWASLGNPGWDWSSFSQSMAKVYSVKEPPWGSIGEGPVHVSFADEETRWPGLWRDTFATLGFPSSMNPFSGHLYGAFAAPESLHPVTKSRSYAGWAYLEPVWSRGNLTVWTQVLVDKVVFDRTDIEEILATGVQYTDGNITSTVQARKEVILSAGAIHSPKLLELSGVGDAQLLQSLGIDVVIDNQHVGENLQNHVYVCWTCETVVQEGFETLDGLPRQEPAAIASAQEAMMKGKGPLTSTNTNGSAFMPLPTFSTDDGKRELDELILRSGAVADPGKAIPAFAKARESFVRPVLAAPTGASGLYQSCPGYAFFQGDGDMEPPPSGTDSYLSITVNLCHPLSRGSTHITSPSASSPGLAVDPNYPSHPLDVEILARHIQQAEKLKGTEPLVKQLIPDGKRV